MNASPSRAFAVAVDPAARMGAGSVVLQAVTAYATVTAVPGRVIGTVRGADPGLTMDHGIR